MRSTLRAGVLCCAVGGLLGLTVGCSLWGDTKTPTKDEAAAALKVKFDEMDKKVAELKDKADKATGDEKGKLEAKWKESAAKRDAAKKKLDDLKAAAADKWDAVKTETDKALDEFKKSVE